LGPWRVHRAGYGAMQLAGDEVFGPPRDPDEAVRVLRTDYGPLNAFARGRIDLGRIRAHWHDILRVVVSITPTTSAPTTWSGCQTGEVRDPCVQTRPFEVDDVQGAVADQPVAGRVVVMAGDSRRGRDLFQRRNLLAAWSSSCGLSRVAAEGLRHSNCWILHAAKSGHGWGDSPAPGHRPSAGSGRRCDGSARPGRAGRAGGGSTGPARARPAPRAVFIEVAARQPRIRREYASMTNAT
jgi:hypothetical protein